MRIKLTAIKIRNIRKFASVIIAIVSFIFILFFMVLNVLFSYDVDGSIYITLAGILAGGLGFNMWQNSIDSSRYARGDRYNVSDYNYESVQDDNDKRIDINP